MHDTAVGLPTVSC